MGCAEEHALCDKGNGKSLKSFPQEVSATFAVKINHSGNSKTGCEGKTTAGR